MDYTKQLLGGSTDGKPIKVVATSIGSGTTIHTAVAGTSAFDEIYLYVTNTDSSDHTLTISWGSTTAPDGLVCNAIPVPANTGPVPVIPGLLLQNGLLVLAAADTTDVLLITGFVNNIA